MKLTFLLIFTFGITYTASLPINGDEYILNVFDDYSSEEYEDSYEDSIERRFLFDTLHKLTDKLFEIPKKLITKSAKAVEALGRIPIKLLQKGLFKPEEYSDHVQVIPQLSSYGQKGQDDKRGTKEKDSKNSKVKGKNSKKVESVESSEPEESDEVSNSNESNESNEESEEYEYSQEDSIERRFLFDTLHQLTEKLFEIPKTLITKSAKAVEALGRIPIKLLQKGFEPEEYSDHVQVIPQLSSGNIRKRTKKIDSKNSQEKDENDKEGKNEFVDSVESSKLEEPIEVSNLNESSKENEEYEGSHENSIERRFIFDTLHQLTDKLFEIPKTLITKSAKAVEALGRIPIKLLQKGLFEPGEDRDSVRVIPQLSSGNIRKRTKKIDSKNSQEKDENDKEGNNEFVEPVESSEPEEPTEVSNVNESSKENEEHDGSYEDSIKRRFLFEMLNTITESVFEIPKTLITQGAKAVENVGRIPINLIQRLQHNDVNDRVDFIPDLSFEKDNDNKKDKKGKGGKKGKHGKHGKHGKKGKHNKKGKKGKHGKHGKHGKKHKRESSESEESSSESEESSSESEESSSESIELDESSDESDYSDYSESSSSESDESFELDRRNIIYGVNKKGVNIFDFDKAGIGMKQRPNNEWPPIKLPKEKGKGKGKGKNKDKSKSKGKDKGKKKGKKSKGKKKDKKGKGADKKQKPPIGEEAPPMMDEKVEKTQEIPPMMDEKVEKIQEVPPIVDPNTVAEEVHSTEDHTEPEKKPSAENEVEKSTQDDSEENDSQQNVLEGLSSEEDSDELVLEEDTRNEQGSSEVDDTTPTENGTEFDILENLDGDPVDDDLRIVEPPPETEFDVFGSISSDEYEDDSSESEEDDDALDLEDDSDSDSDSEESTKTERASNEFDVLGVLDSYEYYDDD